jgi:hypothetical protein
MSAVSFLRNTGKFQVAWLAGVVLVFLAHGMCLVFNRTLAAIILLFCL